ncbi:MAG: serine/threonine protein kinase [Dehalococcoidia bacterium]
MVSDKEKTPEKIDRFLIRLVLDESDVSSIYLAEDPPLRREVVLKVLRPSLAQDTKWEARFRKEAQLTAELVHENIIRVIDVERSDGYLYMILDYVPNSLAGLLRESNGSLTVQLAVSLARQIANALTYTHARDIVHRDLKASNILITSDNKAKLVDFGVARDGRDAGVTVSRREDTVVGTPQYMSPEQVTGGRVDGRSDIFSLGVLLCQMLTGHTPLDQLVDARAVVDFHRARQRMPYLDLLRAAGVPEPLQRIVGRALEIQPELRFQGAAELEAELRDFTDNPPPAPTSRWLGIGVSGWKPLAAGVVAVWMVIGILWVFGPSVFGSFFNPTAAALEACQDFEVAGFNVNGDTYDPATSVLIPMSEAGSEDLRVRFGVAVRTTPVGCEGNFSTKMFPHIDGIAPESPLESGVSEEVVLSIPAESTEVMVLTTTLLDLPGSSLNVDSHILLKVEPNELVQ